LEVRCKRDLVENKIVTGKEDIDRDQLFQLTPDTQYKRTSIEAVKKPCRINVHKFFCSQRVVDNWNSLPSNLVQSPLMNTF